MVSSQPMHKITWHYHNPSAGNKITSFVSPDVIEGISVYRSAECGSGHELMTAKVKAKQPQNLPYCLKFPNLLKSGSINVALRRHRASLFVITASVTIDVAREEARCSRYTEVAFVGRRTAASKYPPPHFTPQSVSCQHVESNVIVTNSHALEARGIGESTRNYKSKERTNGADRFEVCYQEPVFHEAHAAAGHCHLCKSIHSVRSKYERICNSWYSSTASKFKTHHCAALVSKDCPQP
ncbi:unnamed protein product [Soboliphyme baturini]|uniref:Uncharacterized protein n=1 Tax=Soboliphyme baturini TaxID=241478 RepID=A0A183IRF4_9BILA|nr:unnamed protein product [Soboliphyme baturini]